MGGEPGRLGGQRCGAGQPRAWGLGWPGGPARDSRPTGLPIAESTQATDPTECPHPGCEKAFTQLSNLQVSACLPTLPARCTAPSTLSRELSCLLTPAVLPTVSPRQHNKDKPYKCPNCYRAYSDSASLQIHLSAHAVKHAKGYCCSMCGRAYTSVSARPKGLSLTPGPSALY